MACYEPFRALRLERAALVASREIWSMTKMALTAPSSRKKLTRSRRTYQSLYAIGVTTHNARQSGFSRQDPKHWWRTFEINVHGDEYTVPASLSSFKRNTGRRYWRHPLIPSRPNWPEEANDGSPDDMHSATAARNVTLHHF